MTIVTGQSESHDQYPPVTGLFWSNSRVVSDVSVRRLLQFLDRFSLVSPLPVSFPYPGLTVPTLPGGLASLSLPGATRLGFPPLPAGVCVLLISNLNPEVGPSLCFFHHLLVVHHHPAGALKSSSPLTFDLMILNIFYV